jgi:hypothetical protein
VPLLLHMPSLALTLMLTPTHFDDKAGDSSKAKVQGVDD